MRVSIQSAAVLAIFAAAALAASAFAATPNPQCVQDSAQQFLLCKANCREEFLADKDMCRNIDHDCADACRASLESCLDGPDGPLTQFAACRLGCEETLATAVAACRNQFAEGTPERDQCIDAAQIAAFSCRDTCREGVRAGVRACRLTFRACILQCPPPPAP